MNSILGKIYYFHSPSIACDSFSHIACSDELLMLAFMLEEDLCLILDTNTVTATPLHVYIIV